MVMVKSFVYPIDAMCRRSHRNTRWIGPESHRKNIKILETTAIRCRSLYGAYETEPDAVSISYAVIRIFGPITRHSSRSRRTKMVHFLASHEKHRDLICGDDDRTYGITGSHPMGEYRFGRTQGRHVRVHARSAFVLVSFLRGAVGSLVTFLGPSWDGPAKRYRPEDHYMLGPGPKWREKHVLDRASAGGS